MGALALYFDSTYYIGKITLEEIEDELELSLASDVETLEYQSYGLAEEWGEKLLYRLGKSSCSLVTKKLSTESNYSENPMYHPLFKKHDIYPKSVFRKAFHDPNGDFRIYIADRESCTLFRLNHIE